MDGKMFFFFFFQAEDGIRDLTVTGVQTCALPIWGRAACMTGRGPGRVTGRVIVPRTGSRQPPRIVREPGTTVPRQIEDWLAGQIAAGALRPGEDDPVYEVRRIRLADGRPIALEHSLFPAARFPGMLGFRLDGSLYELLEVRYGLRPHRARESLEPVTAGVREAEALDVAEGAPLMRVERTAYARSGEPLEFARDLFRGDRTRVVVWTSELAEDT